MCRRVYSDYRIDKKLSDLRYRYFDILDKIGFDLQIKKKKTKKRFSNKISLF